ncbi:hypothetical protein [Acinetobacter vivianii]|uniref:hypothetical protein n=1 Tax=Acinetobacter vivianii TaxID=1776742 RepID=UPI0019034A75|nr:hypothetical protein [Acinetobacter vivianii]MBJ8482622.1 hypothetical protein [Acinetobacter vivianii]
MIRTSLEDKIKDIVFWTIVFFILYTILGFLLETNWLSKTISLPKINEILKDSLTITATFLAPVAAFVLFSDWREQHNKQVRNEFGLKVFNQFEKFSKEIDKASFLFTELDCLMPDEHRDKLDPNRMPLMLYHPIFEENRNLILSFWNQIHVIQEEFNTLIDKFRYFGVVTNQLRQMESWLKNILEEFENIHDELNDSYSEYLQFLEIIDEKLNLYKRLRSQIERKLTINILQQLQEG